MRCAGVCRATEAAPKVDLGVTVIARQTVRLPFNSVLLPNNIASARLGIMVLGDRGSDGNQPKKGIRVKPATTFILNQKAFMTPSGIHTRLLVTHTQSHSHTVKSSHSRTMSDDTLTPQVLAEYESQLRDVQELLEASPEDESLLTLQRDLQELIAITQHQLLNTTSNEEVTDGEFPREYSEKINTQAGDPDPLSVGRHTGVVSAAAAEALIPDFEHTATMAAEISTSNVTNTNHEKKKRVKEFQVPPHLVIRDNDSEAEKNRKKRAIKTLKSKYRAEKKDYEADKKQQTWQSFQKKKKIKTGTMFSTSDDTHAKVGVVSSGRTKTSFHAKQRPT